MNLSGKICDLLTEKQDHTVLLNPKMSLDLEAAVNDRGAGDAREGRGRPRSKAKI